MTQQRLDFTQASPDAVKAMYALEAAIAKLGVEHALLELIRLRASQINGCAFCLEMHSKALRKSGVPQHKLDALAGWRVSAHFSDAERAALAWAESVTHIAESHAEDAVYQPLLDHFSARQISDLTFAISLMNAFNRLAVSMRL